jgi:hypothetical protein
LICTHCGQTAADDARFCQRCGRPFAATTNQLAVPQTDPKAIASLVCGLLGVAPLAIILGHWARITIRGSAGRTTGDGMALAGLILGYASLLLLVIAIIVSFLLRDSFYYLK